MKDHARPGTCDKRTESNYFVLQTDRLKQVTNLVC